MLGGATLSRSHVIVPEKGVGVTTLTEKGILEIKA